MLGCILDEISYRKEVFKVIFIRLKLKAFFGSYFTKYLFEPVSPRHDALLHVDFNETFSVLLHVDFYETFSVDYHKRRIKYSFSTSVLRVQFLIDLIKELGNASCVRWSDKKSNIFAS